MKNQGRAQRGAGDFHDVQLNIDLTSLLEEFGKEFLFKILGSGAGTADDEAGLGGVDDNGNDRRRALNINMINGRFFKFFVDLAALALAGFDSGVNYG